MNKESRRNNYFKRLGTTVLTVYAAGVIEGCQSQGQEEIENYKTPTPITTEFSPPTSTAIPTETTEKLKSSPSPSNTQELRPQKTKNILVETFPKRELNPDFVKNGFYVIGVEEDTQTDLIAYSCSAWNEDIKLPELVEDEIKALKTLAAYGSRMGEEGAYQPSEILPKFGDLSLLRFPVDEVPEGLVEDETGIDIENSELHLTILGSFEVEKGKRRIAGVIEKKESGSEEVPKHCLAILPMDSNKEDLSLANLGEANGYSVGDGEVEFSQGGEYYSWEINSIPQEFADLLEKEAETPTSTQTPTPTNTLTRTPTPLPTATPTKEKQATPTTSEKKSVETPTAVEPKENKMKLLEVPLDAQDFSLSCESAAAAMVAAYYDVPVPEGYTSLEDYFIKTIPKDCNPHEGYRGLISGALSTSCDAEAGLGYGVYAEPVADGLQRLGVSAEVHYDVDYDWVTKQVQSGRPVVVWMSGKNVEPEYEVDPETGQEYVLYLGQHLWVVSGVEEVNGRNRFRVNDPWKGRQFWVWGFPNWHIFNNMSIVAGQ